MPRTCTICQHPERKAINAALATGEAYRSIAQRFAASPDSVYRHKLEHLPVDISKAQAAKEIAQADTLLGQLQALRGRAHAILDRAEQAGDLRTALLAIREVRACLETLLEVEGELSRRPVVNLHLSAEWQRVQVILMQALAPYPDARIAAAQALLEADHDRSEPSPRT